MEYLIGGLVIAGIITWFGVWLHGYRREDDNEY